jgi:hypothetical protein
MSELINELNLNEYESETIYIHEKSVCLEMILFQTRRLSKNTTFIDISQKDLCGVVVKEEDGFRIQ